MLSVRKSEIPATALAQSYLEATMTRVDCYKISTPDQLSLEDFVGQFYRGRLFRFERIMIKIVTGHASSEAQLKALLAGESKTFSAWTESARTDSQLIMCDYQGRTCSWFMVEPNETGTDLYFGTILKPTNYFKRGEWLSKPIFTAFLPIHGLYSRLLLSQAAKGIKKR